MKKLINLKELNKEIRAKTILFKAKQREADAVMKEIRKLLKKRVVIERQMSEESDDAKVEIMMNAILVGKTKNPKSQIEKPVKKSRKPMSEETKKKIAESLRKTWDDKKPSSGKKPAKKTNDSTKTKSPAKRKAKRSPMSDETKMKIAEGVRASWVERHEELEEDIKEAVKAESKTFNEPTPVKPSRAGLAMAQTMKSNPAYANNEVISAMSDEELGVKFDEVNAKIDKILNGISL